MSSLVQIVRLVGPSLLLLCAAVAQDNWACADNGGTNVVTNSGSGNESYTFQMNVQATYDHTLVIKVVTLDEHGVITAVHQTIEWNIGTDPTIIIGQGKTIRIEDPQDADHLAGLGTYRKN